MHINKAFSSLLIISLLAVSCGDDKAAVTEKDMGADTSTDQNPDQKLGGPDDDDDGDGLTNKQEADGWEISIDRIGLGVFVMETVTSDPRVADTDSDGLDDGEEFQKTDPRKPDTDGDGLTDTEEVRVFLSIPSSVDSDGDSISGATSNPQLWDGEEVNKWGTSPSLADSDGDNKSDFDEIINNATNPLVAQVPSVQLGFAGEIDVRLNVEYEDGAVKEVEYGSTYGVETSSALSQTDGTATTNSVENSSTISATVESGLPPSASVSYSRTKKTGFSREDSASLTKASARSSQREFQRANRDSVTRIQKTQTGSLSMGLIISNPSDLAYKLTNLAVSVFQWDFRTQNFRTVGTLEPQLEEFNLAPGESKSVPQQISATNVDAGLIREFLRQPKSLFFSVSNFDMENAEGLNFAFLDETTNARTGRVVIDYGNGTIEEFRVATNIRRNIDGSLAGVTLDTIFNEYLKIPYDTEPWAAIGVPPESLENRVGKSVLTEVKGVKNMLGNETGFWAVFSDIADININETNFGDIVLQRGESIHIAYLRDKDGDGVYDREEAFHNSDDTNPDTDGDTLTDFEEVKEGWMAGVGLNTTDYPRQVFSDPTIADADEDGLDDPAEKAAGTDPHNPDTDLDGIIDSLDMNPLDNSNDPPVIAVTATLLDDPVVAIDGTVTDPLDDIKSVVIDWGDGSVETVLGNNDPFYRTHGYLNVGTYTITLVATDVRNGVSPPSTFMVTTTKPLARAHYTLDGGFIDIVGGKNANLTQSAGGNTRFRLDRFNAQSSAFEFDNDFMDMDFAYATVSNFGTIPLDNFAIAVWAYGGSGYAIVQPHRVSIEFAGNGITVRLGDRDPTPLEAPSTFGGSGTWTFFVVTKSGPNLDIYANGVLVASSVRPNIQSQNCGALFISATLLTSGCDTSQDTTNDSNKHDAFLSNTTLDDIRIFDRPLNATDIQALYLEKGFVP